MEHQQVEDITISPTAHVVLGNEDQISNMFCCAALADKTHRTLHTDMTGAFPVQSLEEKHSLWHMIMTQTLFLQYQSLISRITLS